MQYPITQSSINPGLPAIAAGLERFQNVHVYPQIDLGLVAPDRTATALELTKLLGSQWLIVRVAQSGCCDCCILVIGRQRKDAP